MEDTLTLRTITELDPDVNTLQNITSLDIKYFNRHDTNTFFFNNNYLIFQFSKSTAKKNNNIILNCLYNTKLSVKCNKF